MADIALSTVVSGSNHVVSMAWGIVPKVMPWPTFGAASAAKGPSYELQARQGLRYLYNRPAVANTIMGQEQTPGGVTFGLPFRYTSASAFERLQFSTRTEYFCFGSLTTDATFDSWYASPPAIYGRGNNGNGGLVRRFFGIPSTIPATWSVDASPTLWGEDRVTARGRRQLIFLEETANDGAIYLGADDGQLYYAVDPDRDATLHGLPGTIHANDSVNGGSGASVTIEYRWQFDTIDQTNGEVIGGATSAIILSTSDATWTPNVWRLRGPQSVSVPTIPSNAFAYRLQRRWTVDGNPGSWGLTGSWYPLAPAWGFYDICDPCTGAWLPAALFNIPS